MQTSALGVWHSMYILGSYERAREGKSGIWDMGYTGSWMLNPKRTSQGYEEPQGRKSPVNSHLSNSDVKAILIVAVNCVRATLYL